MSAMTDLSKLERSIAQMSGEDFYFTDRLCLRGHIDKRRTVNGSCLECEREYDRKRIRPDEYGKRYYWRNLESQKRHRKASYARHREREEFKKLFNGKKIILVI